MEGYNARRECTKKEKKEAKGEMMVYICTLFIGVLSLIQDKKRAVPAQIFAFFYLLYAIFFINAEGFDYFFYAIIVDVLIVSVISQLKYDRQLTLKLMVLSLSFMVLNVWAWISWEYHIDYEITYNFASIFLYLSIIASLIEGNKNGRWNILRGPFDYTNRFGHKGGNMDSSIRGKN